MSKYVKASVGKGIEKTLATRAAGMDLSIEEYTGAILTAFVKGKEGNKLLIVELEGPQIVNSNS